MEHYLNSISTFIRNHAFLGNVIAGVVASIIVLTVGLVKGQLSSRRNFAKLSGTYTANDIEGQPIDGDGKTKVKWQGGNVLEIKGDSAKAGKWEGRLTMNVDLPELGRGAYQYLDRTECGVHQIQVRSRNEIH